jgi:hypothetical protein
LSTASRFEGRVENFTQRARHTWLRRCAANARELRHFRGDLRLDDARRHTELVEDRRDDPAFLADESEQQVLRRKLRVARATREVLRLGDGFLRFDCKFVEIHWVTSR